MGDNKDLIRFRCDRRGLIWFWVTGKALIGSDVTGKVS
jgi:hypothetical protein